MKITEKQMPGAAVEAAESVIKDGFYNGMGVDEIARAALAAALNAWEGVCIRTRMQPDPMHGGQWMLSEKMLSLPLPKEPRT
jgi:hypothetical protein